MARPLTPIDERIVKGCAEIQCTHEEIAAVVGVNESTIIRRFAGKIAEWRKAGKMSLRRMQWKAAQNGNSRILIHLGKNYLGQSDGPQEHVVRHSFNWDALCQGNGEVKEEPDLLEAKVLEIEDQRSANKTADSKEKGENSGNA